MPNINEVECNVALKGSSDSNQKQIPCEKGANWRQDDNCRSPITDPVAQCRPKKHRANFQKVEGQFAFSVQNAGAWEFKIEATIIPAEGERGFDADHIVGSVDKVCSKL